MQTACAARRHPCRGCRWPGLMDLRRTQRVAADNGQRRAGRHVGDRAGQAGLHPGPDHRRGHRRQPRPPPMSGSAALARNSHSARRGSGHCGWTPPEPSHRACSGPTSGSTSRASPVTPPRSPQPSAPTWTPSPREPCDDRDRRDDRGCRAFAEALRIRLDPETEMTRDERDQHAERYALARQAPARTVVPHRARAGQRPAAPTSTPAPGRCRSSRSTWLALCTPPTSPATRCRPGT